MTNHTLRISPQAEEDLFEIWYIIAIENKNRSNADKFIDQLDKQFIGLLHSPNIGRKRDIYFPNLRAFPFENYIIYNLPFSQGIEILRILHSKRDSEIKNYQ